MDNKTFLAKLSQLTGEKAGLSEKCTILAETLAQACTSLDSVAIPGFGTFSGVKKDESIQDGQLLPPAIEANFRQSVVLKKRLQQ